MVNLDSAPRCAWHLGIEFVVGELCNRALRSQMRSCLSDRFVALRTLWLACQVQRCGGSSRPR